MPRSTLDQADTHSPIVDKVQGAPHGEPQGDPRGGRDDEGEEAGVQPGAPTAGTLIDPGRGIPDPAAEQRAGESGAQPRPEGAREDRSYSRRRRTLRSRRLFLPLTKPSAP